MSAVRDSGVRVSNDSGFRVSSFKFRVLGFGFWILKFDLSGSGLWLSGLPSRLRVEGRDAFPVSGVSNTLTSVLCTLPSVCTTLPGVYHTCLTLKTTQDTQITQDTQDPVLSSGFRVSGVPSRLRVEGRDAFAVSARNVIRVAGGQVHALNSYPGSKEPYMFNPQP